MSVYHGIYDLSSGCLQVAVGVGDCRVQPHGQMPKFCDTDSLPFVSPEFMKVTNYAPFSLKIQLLELPPEMLACQVWRIVKEMFLCEGLNSLC